MSVRTCNAPSATGSSDPLYDLMQITFYSSGQYDQGVSQADIDCAYAVKIFLDHHPHRQLSLSALARHAGISESRLKETFQLTFHISLETYRMR
jgi:AraC-like DNA-binding protein